MAKNQNKKMIAPVVIVICLVVFGLLNVVLPAIAFGLPSLIRIGMFIATIAAVAIAIYVLRERIKEIRSGQEDDLGKY